MYLKLRYILSFLAWEVFGQQVLSLLGGVLKTHVEVHYLPSLFWNGIDQHKLKYILCSSSQGIGLFNTSSDLLSRLCFLIVLKTHVEKYFGTTVSEWGYGQLKSIYIMCNRSNSRGFDNKW